MQVVKKLLLGLLLVWGALLLFMPKEELYFSLERELAKQGVEINEGTITESPFGLTLENVTVYVQGIQVATLKEVSLFTLLFYTRIEAEEIKTDKALHSMLPSEIAKLEAVHSVLSPLMLHVKAEGSFGKVEGEVSLNKREVHLDFVETKQIDMLRSVLKKGEKGWYYETSF
jgi:hypothetical protein